MTFYAQATVTANGTTNVFAVPFPYLSEADVHCYVNGSEVLGFTWPSNGTIQLNQSASSLSGATVLVKRITPATSPEVTFQQGGFDPSDVNTQVLQLLYMAQEALDLGNNLAAAAASAAQQAAALYPQSSYAVSQIAPGGTPAVAPTVRADPDRWAGRIAVAGTDFGLPTTGDPAVVINEIMAALDARGGGVVELPMPSLTTQSAIDNHYNRVTVRGLGRGLPHDAGTNATFGTVINAAFSTDAVCKHRTIYGASNTQNTGGGFEGITTTGGEFGLYVDSIRDGRYRMMIQNITGGTSGAKFHSGRSRIDLAETCDVQDCDIDLTFRLLDNATALAADAFVADGSGGTGAANFSFNRVRLRGEWGNGAFCRLVSADSNVFETVLGTAGGTGPLIYCHGPTSTYPVGGGSNYFESVAGTGAIFAEGTDTAGVTAGIINYIGLLNTGNGSVVPTNGVGSLWRWGEALYGSLSNAIMLKAIFSNVYSTGDLINLLAEMGTESLLISNDSANHIVLSDPANGHTFGINVTSTGHLRISPIANTNDTIVLGNTTLGNVGFYGNNPVGTQPVVSGSKGGNAALTSLVNALGSLGLINNTTT